MTTTIVEARDVAVHYGGIKAVDGVTFAVPRGTIFGVLGPNGSGKSTLLGALTRLVDLTRGELRFEGVGYDTLTPHRVAHLGIARTFQTTRLLPRLTVRENIALGAELHGRTSEDAGRIAQAAERAGVTEVLDRRPDEISYGTQRRVEIARALASRPSILMLDEPTAGMGHAERDDIAGLLIALREEGLTQLVVEHDVQMMVDICDHIHVMNFGRTIAEGVPTAVVKDPAVQEAYLGRRWKNRAAHQ